MTGNTEHTFHIPVLGIGFSVDAPLKVARYGISSVVSLVDDALMEDLRKRYHENASLPFIPIHEKEPDARARRITEYLNMLHRMVKEQFNALRNSAFAPGSEINKYFEMLPDISGLKAKYHEMLGATDGGVIHRLQNWLREHMNHGAIDVNIMTKLDKANYANNGRDQLPNEFNDAHAALRGFANSNLESSVVFSAGMNPRLYSYLSSFEDFYPSTDGTLKKRVVIKVSDFRSALIQGKFLAKKGIWVSEFRIESGLNCGGHAFATDGYLLGPILNEFKQRRGELFEEMSAIYLDALRSREMSVNPESLPFGVTVQGGVGTAGEQDFLHRYFEVQSVGWGSPFLLVPEVMNVDDDTLGRLQRAHVKDLYLSEVSPLGVPFNSLRGNTKEKEKWDRVDAGKPGSACVKKFLQFNSDHTDKPICTASITYLKKKKAQLQEQYPDAEEFGKHYDEALEKECLCEGLIVSTLTVNDIEVPKISKAVSVCPGPNLAYFSKVATLRDMVDHIYGRLNLVTDADRPNMFIKELHLYIDYLQNYIRKNVHPISEKTQMYIDSFRQNLLDGIEYYRQLIPEIMEEAHAMRERMQEELEALEGRLMAYATVA